MPCRFTAVGLPRHAIFYLHGRRLLGAGLLWLCSFSAQAGAIDQLKGFVTTVKSARGEFTQRQMQDGSSEKFKSSTSSGSFEFLRPGKFVWRYLKPYEQQLQADGEKLYIWDKDLNQVTVKTLGEALASNPASVLFGNTDLEKQFRLKEAGGGGADGVEWAELIPLAGDSQFQRIAVGFKAGALAAMELRDAFGNVTLLTFGKLEKNVPLTAAQFRFEVPKGADVIGP